MLKCRDLGYDDSKIVVDIISCGRTYPTQENQTSTTIGNYLRYREIKTFNHGLQNLYEFQKAYPHINYRYFFQASQPLTSGLQEMEFTPEVLGPMIEIGKKDAEAAVKQGEGKSFARFNEWFTQKSMMKNVSNLESYLYQ